MWLGNHRERKQSDRMQFQWLATECVNTNTNRKKKYRSRVAQNQTCELKRKKEEMKIELIEKFSSSYRKVDE